MLKLPAHPIAIRVARRFLGAKSTLWDRAVKDLREFDAWMHEVRGADLTSEQGEKLLRQFAFLKPDGGLQPSVEGNGFADWLVRAFPDGPQRLKQVDAFRPSGEATMNVAPKDPEMFYRGLGEYERAIQSTLDDTAPTHFTYAGLPINNFDHLSEATTKAMMDSIDHFIAVFKKRGIDGMLLKGVRSVEIRIALEGESGAAYYWERDHSITLTTSLVGTSGYRFGVFEKWIYGTFLHEFGHYIHLTYISPEAKSYWDLGWTDIEEKRQKADEYKRTFSDITGVDRQRFFELLKKNDFNPTAVAKKLKALDKVKFGAWLREPMYGEPLITAAQFRLTKRGQEFFRVLRDPRDYLWHSGYYDTDFESEEGKKLILRTVDRKMDLLGLNSNTVQKVPADVVAEMAKADSSFDKAVQEAMNELGIISEYGRKNVAEDFADTFVAFVAAPEALTPNAKFRMQRTLSLSGLYSKSVMRLATPLKG